MHEWALAEAVVAKVAEVARERGIASVREAVIGLGELQEIEREAFELGLSTSQKDLPEVADAVFTIEVDHARCRCRTCGHDWALGESLDSLPPDDRESVHLVPELVRLYIGCPACASPDFDIVGGRGVALVSVSA